MFKSGNSRGQQLNKSGTMLGDNISSSVPTTHNTSTHNKSMMEYLSAKSISNNNNGVSSNISTNIYNTSVGGEGEQSHFSIKH